MDNPNRKAQNMAALLALIILIGITLPVPIGAGFADWLNALNAPTAIDDKYVEVSASGAIVSGRGADFDMDNTAIYTGSGYKGYFYWHNDSAWLKHNVTGPSSGILTSTYLDTEGEWNYSDNHTESDDDYKWTTGTPYWYVTFNYTAQDAYDNGVTRMQLEFSNLLSVDEDDDEQPCTVVITAGGVTFFEKTLSADATDGGDIEENVTISVDDLRRAIIDSGQTSFFRMKVTGHGADPNTLNMQGCKMYTWNTNKLFGRDDGLYLVSMVSVICAALGIFLVQPRYNLPLGKKSTGRRY